MRAATALIFACALAALPAQAQVRAFNCIGAERLEDDVYAIAFRPGRATLETAARTPLAAAAEAAKDQARNICVLGHAAQEGGQATTTRLAAQRARAVADALSVEFGIERDRIRAEARNPGFARRTPNREARSVTIVVLPAPGTAVLPAPGTVVLPAAPPAGPEAPKPGG